MRTLKLCLAAACFATAAQAASFKAENGAEVVPRNDGTLQVFEESFYGARGMWCGAADYALRVKGARGPERIYVKEPLTAGNNGYTVFTFDPTGLEPSRPSVLSKTVETPGANLSVQRAFAFCIQLRAPYNIFG